MVTNCFSPLVTKKILPKNTPEATNFLIAPGQGGKVHKLLQENHFLGYNVRTLL